MSKFTRLAAPGGQIPVGCFEGGEPGGTHQTGYRTLGVPSSGGSVGRLSRTGAVEAARTDPFNVCTPGRVVSAGIASGRCSNDGLRDPGRKRN